MLVLLPCAFEGIATVICHKYNFECKKYYPTSFYSPHPQISMDKY